jgi:Tol biopolymer transport system component
LGSTDIWVMDLSRGISTRLTFSPEWDQFPIWSPDGKRLVYRSRRDGVHYLYEQASTGGDENELMNAGPVLFQPTDWSPDDKFILYQTDETGAGADADLWILPTFG